MARHRYADRNRLGFHHLRWATLRLFGTVAPGWAATWFEKQIFTPSRYSRPYPDEASFTDGERLRIPYGRGWLSAWSWGTGPTVVLMHGWGGRAVHLYEFIRPLREVGFRVVAFDAPAHGDSDGVMTDILECAGAVLQIAGLAGPVHGIIAHSFGAPTAAVALQHGLAPHGMVLIGAPSSLARATHGVARMIGIPHSVSRLMQRRVEARLGITWEGLETDRLLADCDIPLLVLHDKQDRDVPWESGATIARRAKRASLVTTNGLGHRRIVRDPAVVRQAVEFLQACLPTAKTAV